eukprot:CAMPEP_0170200478 /NCGR_PEP_ID=MMETSP0040_2-20121228/69890_1 /TAXON_ID=641309 /ORGANISM="Lotharella oceanica, Strain CCMP622" /LENGTH=35 /DNA_ID= /DNA_START= /DNA_END= /DNA_ORIENTATION=
MRNSQQAKTPPTPVLSNDHQAVLAEDLFDGRGQKM